MVQKYYLNTNMAVNKILNKNNDLYDFIYHRVLNKERSYYDKTR